MEPKFHVAIHGNYSREFHTNVVVGKTPIEQYGKWLLGTGNGWDQIFQVQGSIVADMVTDVLKIDGVDSVFVKPYSVSVHLNTLSNPKPCWNSWIDTIVQAAFLRIAHQTTSPSKKVIIRALGSKSMLEFHSNFEVSKTQIKNFWRPLRASSDQYLKELGPDGAALVRKLMDLPGVNEIWMHPYEVTIMIAEAFGWNEHNGDICLEEKVQKVFKDIFGPDVWFTRN